MTIQTSIYADGLPDFIDQCNGIMSGEYHKLPVSEQRALYEKLAAHFNGPLPAGVHIHETCFTADEQGHRFRVYKTVGGRTDAMVFYIRGGGFVLGSLETHNLLMAEMCAATGLTVVAADFRLAPEAPYPAPIDDCETILRYIVNNAGALGLAAQKIIICGDSSGGDMVVALCMRLRNAGETRVHAQVLFNPVLDFSRWKNGGDDAPLLTAGEMEFYTACYAPGDDVLLPEVPPLVSATFEGLPPAYVMAAELDSLRADAHAYVDRLRKEGIAAELVVEPGLVHGAIRARGLCATAKAAFDRGCDRLVQFANA
jgi:acetyl esterase